jgi:hypothetical protein
LIFAKSALVTNTLPQVDNQPRSDPCSLPIFEPLLLSCHPQFELPTIASKDGMKSQAQ